MANQKNQSSEARTGNSRKSSPRSHSRIACSKKSAGSCHESWAVITRTRGYFVSESSVYGTLKAADLITRPAYILMSASDAFKDSRHRVHEM